MWVKLFWLTSLQFACVFVAYADYDGRNILMSSSLNFIFSIFFVFVWIESNQHRWWWTPEAKKTLNFFEIFKWKHYQIHWYQNRQHLWRLNSSKLREVNFTFIIIIIICLSVFITSIFIERIFFNYWSFVILWIVDYYPHMFYLTWDSWLSDILKWMRWSSILNSMSVTWFPFIWSKVSLFELDLDLFQE